MAEQAEDQKLPEPDDVEALLGFFRLFADQHHQTKEESILFPSLRTATAGKTNAHLHQMTFEHEQERSLIQGLEDALRTRKHSEFAYFGNRLAAVLSNHIYKEDHILFDLVERTLSAPEDCEVVKQMEEFDRTLHPKLTQEWDQTINRLEWKYLNKVA